MLGGDCILCRKIGSLPQAASPDCIFEFPQSVLFLGPWQYYRGYCVLVARWHATELSQLAPQDRHAHLEEMCLAARAIEDAFRPKKMNYELLGNQVPHLHWHLVPRYADDPDFKHPIWVAIDRAKDDKSALRRLEQGSSDRAETARILRNQLAALMARRS